VLELLKNLIHSTVNSTIMIDKSILRDIQTCLQNAHEKTEFLQLESQLQQEELQQWHHHSDSHKQQVDSNPVPKEVAKSHADAEFQSALPKPIIRPWEELVHNKHRTGLGYEKDVSFHIPDYSKPIQFQSIGFLEDISSSLVLHDSSPSVVPDSAPLPKQQKQQQIMKCQHCDRVGHLKDHCFNLHPCKHCHKTNHSSNRCFRNKPPARTNIHLGWIASWQWASTTKKIFQSHVRTYSRVLNSIAVEFSPSSYLVYDRGGDDGHLQASKPHQASLSRNLPYQIQSCRQRQRCP